MGGDVEGEMGFMNNFAFLRFSYILILLSPDFLNPLSLSFFSTFFFFFFPLFCIINLPLPYRLSPSPLFLLTLSPVI